MHRRPPSAWGEGLAKQCATGPRPHGARDLPSNGTERKGKEGKEINLRANKATGCVKMGTLINE